jgi:hypothetical protein
MSWKWALIYVAIVLVGMFLLYTIPRWFQGWGLDMVPL